MSRDAAGKKRLGRILLGIVALVLSLAIVYGFLRPKAAMPSGLYAGIEEVKGLPGIGTLDRNFYVVLYRDGKRTVIFRSPDEGFPPGTERFLWSPDKRWFLLVGRHFYVEPDIRTPQGESCYLLYNIETGDLLFNGRRLSARPFSVQDLQNAGLTFPVTVVAPTAGGSPP